MFGAGEGGKGLAGLVFGIAGEPMSCGVPHADLARSIQRHDRDGGGTDPG